SELPHLSATAPSGSNNSKTLQKQGFVYSLRMCQGTFFFMLITTYGEVSLLFTHTCPVTKHPQNM
ncbi:hypothetical protein, partial [uncultured Clostridium sp.]|uniref:hypothetical protein n=1 Tax=uncultured Clostridium sp. TaxID=59620 RepID=UPI002596A691